MENKDVQIIESEIEKCFKDPVYFYNTYYLNKDGTKPRPITHDYWNEITNHAHENYKYKVVYCNECGWKGSEIELLSACHEQYIIYVCPNCSSEQINNK